jgi:hypothetical protein
MSGPSTEREEVESAEPKGIDEFRAKAMAEAIYAVDGPRMAKFWPAEIRPGEYDPTVLIPALERVVESGEATNVQKAFLQAVQSGRAREFIASRRLWAVNSLRWDLEDGCPDALKLARECGLLPR